MGLAAGGGVSIDLTREEDVAVPRESVEESCSPSHVCWIGAEVRKELYLFANLFLFFETGVHVDQAGPKLIMQPRMTLNS